MTSISLFRVTFSYADSIYEIYARKVHESDMFGFLVVEEFVFGENTTFVVDPSEERLKVEFNEVKRTFIPIHAVLRIDEVNKRGSAKIRDKSVDTSKVSMFPVSGKPRES
jgi:hypothetical protein